MPREMGDKGRVGACLILAICDDPRYRDEYGNLTDDVDDAVDGLSEHFGWTGITAG